ncbi:MAG: hypothetical protein F6K25_02905 [Okeania sp. SIO2G4]|nr:MULTISPECIES: hypothetical protein [unclassified Okeania]NEP93451.1 hypothetical protein [Okeania sp. SIO2F5]NEQ89748.1 hypothetical protein [Okeania sp. SIO2G4]
MKFSVKSWQLKKESGVRSQESGERGQWGFSSHQPHLHRADGWVLNP